MSTKTQDIDSLILKLEEKKKKLLQKKLNQRVQPITDNLKKIDNILKKQLNHLTDEDINSAGEILKDIVNDLELKIEESKKRKEEEKNLKQLEKQQTEEQNQVEEQNQHQEYQQQY